MIRLSYKGIPFDCYHWRYICRPGSLVPMRMVVVGGSAGYWLNRNVFMSYRQMKRLLLSKAAC